MASASVISRRSPPERACLSPPPSPYLLFSKVKSFHRCKYLVDNKEDLKSLDRLLRDAAAAAPVVYGESFRVNTFRDWNVSRFLLPQITTATRNDDRCLVTLFTFFFPRMCTIYKHTASVWCNWNGVSHFFCLCTSSGWAPEDFLDDKCYVERKGSLRVGNNNKDSLSYSLLVVKT